MTERGIKEYCVEVRIVQVYHETVYARSPDDAIEAVDVANLEGEFTESEPEIMDVHEVKKVS